MSHDETEVLVVGGGQSGIAMSEHLGRLGIDHLVLERDRVAEAWRTGRWDSLCANGPAWHDRFPGLELEGVDPDAFAPKERVARYFAEYAEMIGAPLRTGVQVHEVRRAEDGHGFLARTSEGTVRSRYVVAATGPFQKAAVPRIIPETAGITQLHSSAYRNPEQLPEGGVLVVGAGSSGVQIADELRRAGRDVHLSVGEHDRPPRRYRGRDNVWWLGVLGLWDMATPGPGKEHTTIAVTGARGGYTIDFRDLAASGVRLVGRTDSFADGVLRFREDLAGNLAGGDANFLSVLEAADRYVERTGLDLPPEPEAHRLGPLPQDALDPVLELDLRAAGITSVVWATGFGVDYSWLQVDTFDDRGRPLHERGVSREPGVYFLGLPWLSRRGSSFIWGTWHDARNLADLLDIQRGYARYDGDARVVATPAVARV